MKKLFLTFFTILLIINNKFLFTRLNISVNRIYLTNRELIKISTFNHSKLKRVQIKNSSILPILNFLNKRLNKNDFILKTYKFINNPKNAFFTAIYFRDFELFKIIKRDLIRITKHCNNLLISTEYFFIFTSAFSNELEKITEFKKQIFINSLKFFYKNRNYKKCLFTSKLIRNVFPAAYEGYYYPILISFKNFNVKNIDDILKKFFKYKIINTCPKSVKQICYFVKGMFCHNLKKFNKSIYYLIKTTKFNSNKIIS